MGDKLSMTWHQQVQLGQGAGTGQIMDTIVDRVSGIRSLTPGGRLLFV